MGEPCLGLKYPMLILGIGIGRMMGPTHTEEAIGPLRVHPTNPRYFTDGRGKAIYLTGSHFWTAMVAFYRRALLPEEIRQNFEVGP